MPLSSSIEARCSAIKLDCPKVGKFSSVIAKGSSFSEGWFLRMLMARSLKGLFSGGISVAATLAKLFALGTGGI